MKSQSSQSHEQPIYFQKMKKVLDQKAVNSISRGESHKKEIHSSFDNLDKAFSSIPSLIAEKNVSQGAYERSYTHKHQKAVFASNGLPENGLTQENDAKKPEEALSKLKIIWNDTVQTLVKSIAPIKKSLTDEAIVLGKKALSKVLDSSKVCFKSLNESLEKKVGEYLDSISKKDSGTSDTWISIKLAIARPLTELLSKLVKSVEEKISAQFVNVINTDKEDTDLKDQIEILKQNTKEEYDNLKQLFDECGNYMSASMVEKLGHLTDFNHDSGSTNFESKTIGNDSQCGCAIF
jgi:hypothetical protein